MGRIGASNIPAVTPPETFTRLGVAGRATVTAGSPDARPGIRFVPPPIGRLMSVPTGSSPGGIPGRSVKCGVLEGATAGVDGAVGPALGIFDTLVRTITGGRGGRTGAVK